MPIDLNNKECRKKFISDNMPELITGINDTYGPILMEELLKRIENTINDFNDEIENVFNLLREKDIQRQDILNQMKSSSKKNDTVNHDSKSEWEKKIEEIETSK